MSLIFLCKISKINQQVGGDLNVAAQASIDEGAPVCRVYGISLRPSPRCGVFDAQVCGKHRPGRPPFRDVIKFFHPYGYWHRLCQSTIPKLSRDLKPDNGQTISCE